MLRERIILNLSVYFDNSNHFGGVSFKTSRVCTDMLSYGMMLSKSQKL